MLMQRISPYSITYLLRTHSSLITIENKSNPSLVLEFTRYTYTHHMQKECQTATMIKIYLEAHKYENVLPRQIVFIWMGHLKEMMLNPI